ncbi:MAG TPA: J domain-containing protein [Sumerlaeia bacterium]|nr:J domain-containing protein [Sumerlaeia bacterium]
MAIQRKIFERVLNMTQMHNVGVLHRGSDMLWTCRWNEGGRESSICYQVIKGPYDGALKLRLRYRVLRDGAGDEQLLDYTVPIKTSVSYKRKTWYWFACPLIINGSPCKRRVRSLYFLPGSEYFGCKNCRDLMIRSLLPSSGVVFRQTESVCPGSHGDESGDFIPELRLGWRPSTSRRICRQCGCLTEGIHCCNCAVSLNGDKENLFELLGIGVRATPDEMRSAFISRLKEYHPDRVAHLGQKLKDLAEQEVKRITRAYRILADPERREAYLAGRNVKKSL